jgi:hypothetical protein
LRKLNTKELNSLEPGPSTARTTLSSQGDAQSQTSFGIEDRSEMHPLISPATFMNLENEEQMPQTSLQANLANNGAISSSSILLDVADTAYMEMTGDETYPKLQRPLQKDVV